MAKMIMVVDDSTSIRQSLRFILEQNGYQVTDAPNGSEALALLKPETQLIMTDINMPVMNGIDFIKAVRGRTDALKAVPILVLTTETQDDLRQKGKEAGATGWIVKPFTADELVAVIRKVIGA
ncbi:MAG TPA: response regulator [Spirochaetota bacterium]|nr:response regulator [Spirochaetota bacterium]